MVEFKQDPFPNPRHDCIALGKGAIIPKVIRQTAPGVFSYWGFKCPLCSMGREFTDEEREFFEENGYEEIEDGEST